MHKQRNEELQKLLDMASKRPDPRDGETHDPRMRIDLREKNVLDNPASHPNPDEEQIVLGDIQEDADAELRAQQSNLMALMNGQL